MGGGDDDERRLVVVHAIGSRQQVEDHRPGGGEFARRRGVGRGDQRRRAALDLPAYGGVEFGGVFQAGRGQEVDAGPACRVRAAVAVREEIGEELRALAWPRMGHRHADDVLPLVVRR
ncbi:hypothetical protein, partial [Streptomyces chryseus]|uniref:hypothetical protein n=1 Tax=Streptomyces chryseus TaxID=68186 RepID=UPI0027E4856F